MDIPHWLSGPALVAALSAVLASVVPIFLKLTKEWISRRASTRLIVKLGDGNTISVEGKSLKEEDLRLLLKVFEDAKPKGKGGVND